MPLYVYQCPKCGTNFEAQKPITDRETAKCPQCGADAQKMMSTCNWSFGWRLSDKSHERFGPRDEYERDI